MGIYSANTNWSRKLEILLYYFEYYFPEIQLMWLYEIVLIKTFMENIAEGNCVPDSNNNYRLAESNAAYTLKSNHKELLVPFKMLANYRHSFVHEGSYNSLSPLRNLYRNKSEINKLAEFAGVSINWNCSVTEFLINDNSFLH